MMHKNKRTYHLISLGCAKNLVDSDSIAQLLNQHGLAPTLNANQADFLIVNTCGFLKAARQEAISVLNDLNINKKTWQKLIVAGCMPELHHQEILDAVPGVAAILGTKRWMDILDVIEQIDRKQTPYPYLHLPVSSTIGLNEQNTQRVAIQGASAYLKIADGCRRSCAYCLIPLIKGTLVSRPPAKIIADARALQDQGVKEIILIAQDITDYGHDLNMKDGLTQLLELLVKAVPHVPWIRLMYTFPGYVSQNLLGMMASEPQILPYLDMPLQHADPKVLKAMHRPSNMQSVHETLVQIREQIPDAVLRTTFIVGFPNEDEKAFQNLVQFTKQIQFDHMGAFVYSFEPGAPAEALGNPIPEDVKRERFEHLMKIQSEISLKRNQSWVGKTLDVIVEGMDEKQGISIGRSYRDAPEIDGLVVINDPAPPGDMVQVKIHTAITHDLIGRLLD